MATRLQKKQIYNNKIGQLVITDFVASGFSNVITTELNDLSSTEQISFTSSLGTEDSIGFIVSGDNKVQIRNSDSLNRILDSNNNEIFARLTKSGSDYIITYYSIISGAETAIELNQTINFTASYNYAFKDFGFNNHNRYLNSIIGGGGIETLFTNVVEVRVESDLPPASGGVINITEDRKVYKFIGDVVINNRIEIASGINASFIADNFGATRVIYTGSDTFITALGPRRVTFQRMHFVSLTGTATFCNISGLDKFFTLPTDVFFYNGILEGFNGGIAILTNIIACVWADSEILQCGKLVIDNGFGVSFNVMFFRNFFSTGQPFIEFKTNASQYEFVGVAFFPTKGDSPFFVDPAITDTSALSLGRVPYQGLVFGGILSFVDIGGGQVRVIVIGGISFEDNDYVTIIGTTNYNFAAIQISNVNPIFLSGTTPVGSFDITATFFTDEATGQVFLLNSGLTGLEVVPFFKEGSTGLITAYADNGAGGTTVTSAGHGQIDNQSLFISNDSEGDYDGGYNIFNTTQDTFDIATPFVANDAQGQWDTGSLDTTNNVISSLNTGGIIPDSQSLCNSIMTTTTPFASITVLSRFIANFFISDENERWKPIVDGRLICKNRTSQKYLISAKAVVQKQNGSTATAFMNFMVKRSGELSFSVLENHPAAQNQIQTSNPSQLTISSLVDNFDNGDELAVGFASDSAFTMNILSIDINVKK